MLEISDPRIEQMRRDIETLERSGNHYAARVLREKLRSLLTPRPMNYVERAIENYRKDMQKGGKR